jgi:hypothetical protein
MFGQKLFASLACFGFFGVALSSPTFAAEPMGAVVAVEGRPTAAGPDGSRPLSAGSEVFEGDTVTVGDGNAQLQLDDGTKLVVGPSSRLILQSYLRRNKTTAKKVGLKALRGTFRIITGNSAKSAYDISTNNATIGIRGTGFDFNVAGKTSIAVLEGAVRLRGRNGQVVNTAAGCGVAEAGASTVAALELDGQSKTDALSELLYIVDQSPLNQAFHLPTTNCLPFLPTNNGGVAPIPPGLLLVPVVPGGIIFYGILNDQNESPVSGPADPIDQIDPINPIDPITPIDPPVD